MISKSIIGIAVLAGIFITIAAISGSVGVGRIEGRITDGSTGDPIIGASAMIIGTRMGATTDTDGRFVISKVETGTYTLRITHLDYTTIEVPDVLVKAHDTSSIQKSMTPKAYQSPAVPSDLPAICSGDM